MEKQPRARKNDERFNVLKDKIRKRLLKYTRRAFRMLPEMDEPRILDVGCGSGIPTLELARLGQGKVIGIDIDHPALDIFARKIFFSKVDSSAFSFNLVISLLNFSCFVMSHNVPIIITCFVE